MPGIMIAGTSSGVGKTTCTLGIMKALGKRNIEITPFKVGPDYIDPEFHRFVSGNPSYNLDQWLLQNSTIEVLYEKHKKRGEFSVVEGVMGLYDGVGTSKDVGSSAAMAKLLGLPVILVIDGGKKSTSAAAEVLGFKMYDPEVNIEGVIVNKVSGKAHYDIIKTVIERDVKIPCVGYLKKDEGLHLKSRHLGLVPAKEVENLQEQLETLSERIEETVDLDTIIAIGSGHIPRDSKDHQKFITLQIDKLRRKGKGLSLGVFQDPAFSFYYQDNLEILEEIGITLEFISPMKDQKLKEGLSGLYIGGGFPEVFGRELSENRAFMSSLTKDLEKGLPTFAECGGLMYLTEGIEDLRGEFYPMTGFFPAKTVMTERLQRFGYVDVTMEKNITLKAHEFHRSKLIERIQTPKNYQVQKSREGKVLKEHQCGLKRENTLAGYPHFHFYDHWEFLQNWIEEMRRYHDQR